jgi:hypothetical protein
LGSKGTSAQVTKSGDEGLKQSPQKHPSRPMPFACPVARPPHSWQSRKMGLEVRTSADWWCNAADPVHAWLLWNACMAHRVTGAFQHFVFFLTLGAKILHISGSKNFRRVAWPNAGADWSSYAPTYEHMAMPVWATVMRTIPLARHLHLGRPRS